MRRLFTAILLVLIGVTIGVTGKVVRAQTTTLQLTGNAPHTTCAVVPSTTNYCFASDGLWESKNGAPYVELTPALTGGVTSVNGKTGVVVLTVQ